MASQCVAVALPQRRERKNAQPEPIDPELTQLILQSRGNFLRYLGRRLGNREDAEDILQEFYLRVITKADQIRDTTSTMAWLWTVLKSVLIDHIRRRTVERQGLQLMIEEWVAIHPDQAQDDQAQCSCLYKLVPTLKPEYADALVRIDLEEASQEDVARTLEISPGNMRVRLHRARQALRQALQHSCNECKERECFLRGEESTARQEH